MIALTIIFPWHQNLIFGPALIMKLQIWVQCNAYCIRISHDTSFFHLIFYSLFCWMVLEKKYRNIFGSTWSQCLSRKKVRINIVTMLKAKIETLKTLNTRHYPSICCSVFILRLLKKKKMSKEIKKDTRSYAKLFKQTIIMNQVFEKNFQYFLYVCVLFNE